MDRARIDDLWSRFLAGGALHPDEEAEVARAFEADPRLLAEFSRDLQLDRSLRGLGLAERDEDAFVDSFSYRLRTERDGTRFIATVKQRMKRSRKPPTRRWQRSSWTAARAGFAAAVLLALLGIILAASSSSTSPKPPSVTRRAPERIEPVEVRPQPPTPPRPERVPPPVPAPAPDPLRPPVFPERPVEKKEETVPPKATAESREPEKPAPARDTAPTRILVPVATITRVSGDVTLAATPVRAGQKLFAGQPLEAAGAKSGAQVTFPDGTKVEVGPDTAAEVAEGRGKRIVLARGLLNADVTKQPADQPMIVATPHGEARVLGTVFRVSVEGGAMRLDVKEGKVRLTRSTDQKTVDVPAGCFASAGPEKGDLDLNSEHKVTLSFQDGVSPTPRYAGTSDVILVENPKLAEKNTGVYNNLWVDGDTTNGDDRYAMLRWDLAGLPPRCTILTATIDLQVTNDSKGTTFDVYELKRDWVEKEATWKFFAAKSPWQTPGAQGAQDRGAGSLGVLAPRQAGAYTFKLNPDGVSVVQSWADAPASNHGLLIANPDNQDAIGFHSREASLPAHRPRLNITFLPRK